MKRLFSNVRRDLTTRPDITEENRLNNYRFTKHVPEFQRLLQDEYIKRALGSVATAWLLELSKLLVPADTKNNILIVPRTQPDRLTIPLRFVDDVVTVDAYRAIKSTTLVGGLPVFVQQALEEGIRNKCKKEFTLGYDNTAGYTLEYFDRQPIILLHSGLYGANMASTMCHELIHAWQIVGRLQNTEDAVEDIQVARELEAYHYQALFDKGLQQGGASEYSIFAMSGLAQKINFIRAKHARHAELYKVTPKMKQELIARGFGTAVFSSLREEAIEKTD